MELQTQHFHTCSWIARFHEEFQHWSCRPKRWKSIFMYFQDIFRMVVRFCWCLLQQISGCPAALGAWFRPIPRRWGATWPIPCFCPWSAMSCARSPSGDVAGPRWVLRWRAWWRPLWRLLQLGLGLVFLSYGKLTQRPSPFLIGKSTISMVIFNSNVSLPEGILWFSNHGLTNHLWLVLSWSFFFSILRILSMNSPQKSWSIVVVD